MRSFQVIALALVTACGGATDTSPTRYNFAVVDGANQRSTAGSATLAKPITAQLTRDPQGKFAIRVMDFFAPAIAYAQGIVLKGEPVADQIVCGEESLPGEPKVVPLCAYTLADGKAANTVQGGTKAGVYNIVFTAQVPSQMPVKDSTTVTVEAGAVTDVVYGWPPNIPTVSVGETVRVGWCASPCTHSVPGVTGTIVAVRDQYANEVIPTSSSSDAFNSWVAGVSTGIASRDGSEPGPPTPDATGLSFVVNSKWAGKRITVYFWIETFRGSGQIDVR